MGELRHTVQAALVYREHDLVLRNIRDYFTPDIDEIYIDNEDVYLGGTIGYRFTLDALFLDLGLGPAWLRHREGINWPLRPDEVPKSCGSSIPYRCDDQRFILDLTAAVGVQF